MRAVVRLACTGHLMCPYGLVNMNGTCNVASFKIEIDHRDEPVRQQSVRVLGLCRDP